MNKIHLHTVDLEYIDFVKKKEFEHRGFSRVPNMKYDGRKPKLTCGVVLEAPDTGIKYYVGLTSFNKKNASNILIEVNGDTEPIKGSLRFNFMFPVPDEVLTKKIIEDEKDSRYRDLLTKEYRFIDQNRETIRAKANEVYNKITGKEKCSKTLKENSCDFKLLEDACIEYCQLKGYNDPRKATEEVVEIVNISEVEKEA